MTDLFSAFGLVFVAELGDKSMLLAIALAARYRPWPVVAGIALAATTMMGLSTLVGGAIGAALPERPLDVIAGLLFIGFGLWSLRPGDQAGEDAQLRSGSVTIGVMLAFLVAELGDKSMVATIALASTRAALPTWIGAALGMTVASSIAIAVAHLAGSRLPDRAVRLAAAGAFLVFGVLLLLEGITD